MREIKFEYGFESVNGIVKKVYPLSDIPNIKNKCDVWNELPIVYVRQFTGLLDKNGVDIYEGDVVVSFKKEYEDSPSKNEVRFELGSFKLFCIGKNEIPIFNYASRHLEVIGNIYQTPAANIGVNKI